MVKLANIQNVYLIGIGGIGMSALARYFQNRGCQVAGYDKTATPLTNQLIEEGILITFEDNQKNIPKAFLENSDTILIIYTPAVPSNSAILNHFKNSGFALHKRSQVLGLISEGMYTIAVAGTHGKTTTSTLICYILRFSGNNCSAFLGGISTDFGTNFLIGDNNILIVEADEYDRSFLTLHPDIAVITSMDADHLDIYGDASHLTASFKLFAKQLKKGGVLISKKGLDLESDVTYSIDLIADANAKDIRVENGNFVFDFKNKNVEINNMISGLAGQHNIENAVAAIQVALHLGVNEEVIKEAVASFKGVKRRFEYIVKTQNHIYIDDYAHHPEELRACIKAVRTLYPEKTLTAVFQPHLFTRTRDFADDFANVLATVDDLILLEIYPARENPLQNVDSEMLLRKIDNPAKRIFSKQQAIDYINIHKPHLLLTLGAGDIDTMVLPLKAVLQNA